MVEIMQTLRSRIRKRCCCKGDRPVALSSMGRVVRAEMRTGNADRLSRGDRTSREMLFFRRFA
jgi:hypothetical protein